jgi:hypothetical protein
LCPHGIHGVVAQEPEVPPAAEREKIFTTSAKKKSKRKKKSDAMGAEDRDHGGYRKKKRYNLSDIHLYDIYTLKTELIKHI